MTAIIQLVAGLLVVVALFVGTRSRGRLLVPLALSTLLGWPVFSITAGFRSAIYATDLVLVVTTVMVGLARGTRRVKVPALGAGSSALLLLFLWFPLSQAIGLAICGRYAEAVWRPAFTTVRIGMSVLLFYLAATLGRTPGPYLAAIRAYWAFLLALAVVGLGNMFGFYEVPRLELAGVRWQESTLGFSFMGFIRASVGLLGLTGIAVSVCVSDCKSRRWKALGGLGCLVFGAMIVGSQSRSALFGVLGAGGALLVRGRRGIGRRAIGAVALGTPILLIMLWGGEGASQTFVGRFDTVRGLEETQAVLAQEGRGAVWAEVFRFAMSDPIQAALGVGFDNWDFALVESGLVSLHSAHSLYLQVFAELGMVGLVLYTAWLGGLVVHTRKQAIMGGLHGRKFEYWGSALVGMLIASFGVLNLYPAPLQYNFFQCFILLSGLFVGLARADTNRTTNEDVGAGGATDERGARIASRDRTCDVANLDCALRGLAHGAGHERRGRADAS